MTTKADFSDIYHAPDPREYYFELGDLDYQIPAHAGPVFEQLVAHLRARSDVDTVRVADLCCSYGVNAALLKFDVQYHELIDRYADPVLSEIDPADLIQRDREWLNTMRLPDAVEVVGIDASTAAIEYATAVGLLDAGAAENLEIAEPSPMLERELSDSDLVTVTGGIGYITEETVGKVIDAASCDSPPWVAAMSLDWVDFGPIAEAAAARGLVTERAEGLSYPQRRFASSEEERFVLTELEARDIDPDRHESTGWHLASLFVLRPEEDVVRTPLEALLTLPESADPLDPASEADPVTEPRPHLD